MEVLEILTGPIFPDSYGNSSKKIHGSYGKKIPKLSIIGWIHETFHKFM
jgi:hypothetical protein